MKSFLDYLEEARRNPNQNRKFTSGEQIFDYIVTHKNELDTTFVLFSNVLSPGVNPKTEYNTPLGIYGYPLISLVEYYKAMDTNNPLKNVPFATKLKYATIFKLADKKGLTIIEDYDMNDFEEDFELLLGPISEKYDFNPDDVSDIINNVVDEYGDSIPFDIIWRSTHKLANFLGGKTPVKWNLLLRELNHYKIIDYGDGVIHPNEPAQAVFMTAKDIKVIKTIENITKDIYIEPAIEKTKRYDLATEQVSIIKNEFPNLYNSVNRIKMMKYIKGHDVDDQYFEDVLTILEPLEEAASKGKFKAKIIDLGYPNIAYIGEGKLLNSHIKINDVPSKYFGNGIAFDKFFIKGCIFDNKYVAPEVSNFEFSNSNILACNFLGKQLHTIFRKNISFSFCYFNNISYLLLEYTDVHNSEIYNPFFISFRVNTFDECTIDLTKTKNIKQLSHNEFRDCTVSGNNKVLKRISQQTV